MRAEFLVERSGKTFVLYAGLLDMAHAQGLVSIVTSLVQLPTADNGGVAVFHAIVTLEKDGARRVFTGIGDASPSNVSRDMGGMLIRLAETRAKSRALRDAVNVGVAALEEADYMESDGAARPAARPAPRKKADANADKPCTTEQVKAIETLGARIEENALDVATSNYEVTELSELTSAQAGHIIGLLQDMERDARADRGRAAVAIGGR